LTRELRIERLRENEEEAAEMRGREEKWLIGGSNTSLLGERAE
jgi:hypothetical protein